MVQRRRHARAFVFIRGLKKPKNLLHVKNRRAFIVFFLSFFWLVSHFKWSVKYVQKTMKTGDETKILYECDMTRERGLMVNKYKKKLCAPLEAPWLCTIWAAQQSAERFSYFCIVRCIFTTKSDASKARQNGSSFSDSAITEYSRIKLMQCRWKQSIFMCNKHVNTMSC